MRDRGISGLTRLLVSIGGLMRIVTWWERGSLVGVHLVTSGEGVRMWSGASHQGGIGRFPSDVLLKLS